MKHQTMMSAALSATLVSLLMATNAMAADAPSKNTKPATQQPAAEKTTTHQEKAKSNDSSNDPDKKSDTTSGSATTTEDQTPPAAAPTPGALPPASPAPSQQTAAPQQPGTRGSSVFGPQPPLPMAFAPPDPEVKHPVERPVEHPVAPEPPRTPLPMAFWQVSVANRLGWITSDSYDPFDDDNVLAGAELSATRTLLLQGNVSLALGLTYASAETQNIARGAPTELKAKRFGGVIEGRYHLNHALYGMVRLAPEALYMAASLTDASAASPLEADSWGFAMDMTAGVAWSPLETFELGAGKFGLWVFGEGGFGLASQSDLVLKTSADEDIPQLSSSLNFGRLGLGGPMIRLGVAGTY